MGQRWYSTQLREFLTPDPIGIADSLDILAYSRFDPVNRWDPSGLDCADLADVSDKPKSEGDLTDLAGPRVGEWGRFGESLEGALDKAYVMGKKGNKTGFINNRGQFVCEAGKAAGIACQGFVNYVLAIFLEGTYEAQVVADKERGTKIDPETLLEDRGIQKINGDAPLDKVPIKTLDKSHVYAVQSVHGKTFTDKQGKEHKKGEPTHLWFAVFSQKLNAWVRVEASSVDDFMKTGIFRWRNNDEGKDFNVYDVGPLDGSNDSGVSVEVGTPYFER
jgi:hypothetical protein